MLQTRDYAQALIRNADTDNASDDQIARWVDARLERQQILSDEQPKQLVVFLEEYVLDRPVGGPETWRSQLDHLLAQSKRPNIEVRVLPAAQSPHAAHEGSFTLFELPDPYPRAAYIDTLAGPLFIEEPLVQRCANAWKALNKQAAGPDLSRRIITDRIKEIK